MSGKHIPRRIAFLLYAGLAASALQVAGCGGASDPMSAIGNGMDAQKHAQLSVSSSRSAPRLLVANLAANDVLEFSALDDGDTAPRTIIGGSGTGIQDPIGIASAPDGRIAVIGDNAIPVSVFDRDASGNVAPIYVIMCGSMTVPLGGTFDAGNNLYVTNERYKSAITEFVPTDKGCVTGNRVINGPKSRLIDPRGIQVDKQGRIFVADSGEQPGAIRVFAAGAVGNTPPTRVIIGKSTGLAMPRGLVRDAEGNIYVANFANNTITVYAADANGNALPLRAIGGDKTQLSGPSGLAISSTGTLFVSNLTSNTIVSFAKNASGNIAPKTVIAGRKTLLAGPYNIALSN
jgi:hypothetical protein